MSSNPLPDPRQPAPNVAQQQPMGEQIPQYPTQPSGQYQGQPMYGQIPYPPTQSVQPLQPGQAPPGQSPPLIMHVIESPPNDNRRIAYIVAKFIQIGFAAIEIFYKIYQLWEIDDEDELNRPGLHFYIFAVIALLSDVTGIVAALVNSFYLQIVHFVLVICHMNAELEAIHFCLALCVLIFMYLDWHKLQPIPEPQQQPQQPQQQPQKQPQQTSQAVPFSLP